MAFDFSQSRRVLAVDVLEADGIYTRGHVQEVVDTEHYLVYFARTPDPLQTIYSHAVFRVRNSADPPPKHDESGYSVRIVDEDYYRAKLQAHDDVEVLVSLHPGESKRWYCGDVLNAKEEIVVELRDSSGDLTPLICNARYHAEKGAFSKEYNAWVTTMTIQRAGPRSQEEFSEVDVPDSFKSKLDNPEFVGEWEMETGALVKAVDMERGTMTVLVNESHPLCALRYFRNLEPDLEKKSSTSAEIRSAEDEAGFEADCPLKIKKQKSEDVDGSDNNADVDDDDDEVDDDVASEAMAEVETAALSTALEVSDLLVMIFRRLDFCDRQTLRGVCSVWKELLKSDEFTSSAYFDETLHVTTRSRRGELDRTPFVDRFRYMHWNYSDNLITICVDSVVTTDREFIKDTFVDIWSRMGALIAWKLKSLVTTGKLHFNALVDCLGHAQPVIIKLRNVTLYALECFGII